MSDEEVIVRLSRRLEELDAERGRLLGTIAGLHVAAYRRVALVRNADEAMAVLSAVLTEIHNLQGNVSTAETALAVERQKLARYEGKPMPTAVIPHPDRNGD